MSLHTWWPGLAQALCSSFLPPSFAPKGAGKQGARAEGELALFSLPLFSLYQGLQEAPGPLLPSSQQLLHLPFSPVRNEEWLLSTAPGVLTVGRGSLKAFTVLRKACNKCSFIPVKGQGPRRLTALPKASQQVLEMPAKQGDSPTPRSLDTRWNALVLEPDNLMGPCVTSRRPTLCSLGPTHTQPRRTATQEVQDRLGNHPPLVTARQKALCPCPFC